MVKCDSSARLFSLNDQIILTQTDTTVGFISQNSAVLSSIKTRPNTKPFIRVFTSLKSLKQTNIRVPNRYKKDVRLKKKTTFIIKNQAFRVASYPMYSNILRNLPWSYSTSANESGKKFDREFCQVKADIIIEDQNSLEENVASKLLKINNKKIKRLR